LPNAHTASATSPPNAIKATMCSPVARSGMTCPAKRPLVRFGLGRRLRPPYKNSDFEAISYSWKDVRISRRPRSPPRSFRPHALERRASARARLRPDSTADVWLTNSYQNWRIASGLGFAPIDRARLPSEPFLSLTYSRPVTFGRASLSFKGRRPNGRETR
jgi:hypothetical protein